MFVYPSNNKSWFYFFSLSKEAPLPHILLKYFSPTSSVETSLLLMKEEVEMPTFDADSEAPTTCCKSCCLKGIMCSFNYYTLKEI